MRARSSSVSGRNSCQAYPTTISPAATDKTAATPSNVHIGSPPSGLSLSRQLPAVRPFRSLGLTPVSRRFAYPPAHASIQPPHVLGNNARLDKFHELLFAGALHPIKLAGFTALRPFNALPAQNALFLDGRDSGRPSWRRISGQMPGILGGARHPSLLMAVFAAQAAFEARPRHDPTIASL
jgi:hypothetical protein